jgi:hypothetical protein
MRRQSCSARSPHTRRRPALGQRIPGGSHGRPGVVPGRHVVAVRRSHGSGQVKPSFPGRTGPRWHSQMVRRRAIKSSVPARFSSEERRPVGPDGLDRHLLRSPEPMPMARSCGSAARRCSRSDRRRAEARRGHHRLPTPAADIRRCGRIFETDRLAARVARPAAGPAPGRLPLTGGCWARCPSPPTSPARRRTQAWRLSARCGSGPRSCSATTTWCWTGRASCSTSSRPRTARPGCGRSRRSWTRRSPPGTTPAWPPGPCARTGGGPRCPAWCPPGSSTSPRAWSG